MQKEERGRRNEEEGKRGVRIKRGMIKEDRRGRGKYEEERKKEGGRRGTPTRTTGPCFSGVFSRLLGQKK